MPSHTETDLAGGPFALSYNSKTAADTRSELGVRFDDLTILNDMPLVLRSRTAWAHDQVSDPSLDVVFQALPGPSFIINGAAPPKNSALASAGAELWITPNWSLAAKFDGEIRPPRPNLRRHRCAALFVVMPRRIRLNDVTDWHAADRIVAPANVGFAGERIRSERPAQYLLNKRCDVSPLREALPVIERRLAEQSECRERCAQPRRRGDLGNRAGDQSQFRPIAARNFFHADDRLHAIEQLRMRRVDRKPACAQLFDGEVAADIDAILRRRRCGRRGWRGRPGKIAGW